MRLAGPGLDGNHSDRMVQFADSLARASSTGRVGPMDKPLQGVAETVAVVDGHLQVALDNMPGALVYTDADLNIVVCNDRFKEMYRVP